MQRLGFFFDYVLKRNLLILGTHKKSKFLLILRIYFFLSVVFFFCCMQFFSIESGMKSSKQTCTEIWSKFSKKWKKKKWKICKNEFTTFLDHVDFQKVIHFDFIALMKTRTFFLHYSKHIKGHFCLPWICHAHI